MLNAIKLSAAIRAKKKHLLEAEPEMIGTSPVPDMNAQDIYDLDKKAYIQKMVGSDEKINADETNANEPDDLEIKKMQDARMGRLHSYFDDLDLDY